MKRDGPGSPWLAGLVPLLAEKPFDRLLHGWPKASQLNPSGSHRVRNPSNHGPSVDPPDFNLLVPDSLRQVEHFRA